MVEVGRCDSPTSSSSPSSSVSRPSPSSEYPAGCELNQDECWVSLLSPAAPGQDTSHRRLVFYQPLHAALVRGCADMVEHLTPTSANLAAAAAVDAAATTTTAH